MHGSLMRGRPQRSSPAAPATAGRAAAPALARRAGLAALALATLLVGGCAEEVVHGYVASPAALSQLQPGSSREQVLLVLGTPSTTATIGGEAFYYISQRTNRPIAFLDASVVDQRVLAVYFDDKGKVREIGNYGLEDGKVFDYITRRTKTTGQDIGFLAQLLKGGPGLGLNK
jgi:outer membrane protein assembly factor BamE (lipoprotein component of BamABCDE complex)